jgi:hypothetical protein
MGSSNGRSAARAATCLSICPDWPSALAGHFRPGKAIDGGG